MDWPPYATALRLYAIAEERWAEIDAAYASVNLIRFPAHRFLNCVYAWCIERIEPDKLDDWKFQLEAPIPGHEAAATDMTRETEGVAFMDFMEQHQNLTSKG